MEFPLSGGSDCPQTIGVDLLTDLLARLKQQIVETLAVNLVQENDLVMVSTIHEVINRTRVLESKFLGHERQRHRKPREGKLIRGNMTPLAQRSHLRGYV